MNTIQGKNVSKIQPDHSKLATPAKLKICLINPTPIMRRPISELAYVLSQDSRLAVSVFTPHKSIGKSTQTEKTNESKTLHHQKYLHQKNNIFLQSYETFQPPIVFEWPIPNPIDFLPKFHNILETHDVIHIWTHSYLAHAYILFAARLHILLTKRKQKIILSLDTLPGHTFQFNSWLDSAYWIFNRTIGHFLLQCPTTVHTYTKKLEHVVQTYSVSNIRTIPTGIFIDKKRQNASVKEDKNNKNEKHKKNTMQSSILAHSESPFVFFAGLVTMRKGIDRLLAVAKRMPRISFVVAGEEKEAHIWRKKAGANVHFIGRSLRVLEYMTHKHCICLFLPSRAEGLAGVLMEAMSVKCPIVTSQIFGTTELLDNSCACVIAEQDIKGYCEAINKLHLDKGFAQSITEQAYKRIMTYDWYQLVDQYKEVYGLSSTKRNQKSQKNFTSKANSK